MRNALRTGRSAVAVLSGILPLLAVACSEGQVTPTPTPTTMPTGTGTTTPMPVPPTKNCDVAGATRCDGGRQQTCTADAKENLDWSAKALCSNAGQVCKGSACADAPAAAVAQTADMSSVVDFLLDYHGFRGAVDEKQVKEETQLALLLGDGSGESFYRAAQGVFRLLPAGHSGMSSYDDTTGESACKSVKEDRVAIAGTSWHGVCTAVSGDDFVVTVRRPTANIDLMPGDRIIGVTAGTVSYQGAGMADGLGELPICSDHFPLAEARRDVTGASLLSIARPGWVLRVKPLAGPERDVTVPARLDAPISCGDGFNRRPGVERFTVTERPDGYLVVWFKTFFQTGPHPFPNPFSAAAYTQWIVDYLAELNTEIAKYPAAKGIVWDVRGNGGGSQDLAVALAMGSKAPLERGALYKCLARLPKTHPAEFEPVSTPVTEDYAKVFPVPELTQAAPLFSYPGKQIVVSSGYVYSAADVFVYAAKAAGLKVIGRRGAGAFGAAVGGPAKALPSFVVDGMPMYAHASGWGCVDTAGKDIEGKPPTLDLAIDLAPADLAAGKDTMIEAAVKVLDM